MIALITALLLLSLISCAEDSITTTTAASLEDNLITKPRNTLLQNFREAYNFLYYGTRGFANLLFGRIFTTDYLSGLATAATKFTIPTILIPGAQTVADGVKTLAGLTKGAIDYVAGFIAQLAVAFREQFTNFGVPTGLLPSKQFIMNIDETIRNITRDARTQIDGGSQTVANGTISVLYLIYQQLVALNLTGTAPASSS
ncbi:hypothetical protein HDE_12093 [Halotydeus destructor]|nr:hypothetical protein HDE_12093 [Halotydeus destructor]